MGAQIPEGRGSSREQMLREKRGHGLAARDLVKREGDHFTVTIPSIRTKGHEVYQVRRDEQGRVRCTCAQFGSESQIDPKYYCEHIYAVRAEQAKKERKESEALTSDKSNHVHLSADEKVAGDHFAAHGAGIEANDSRDAARVKREREIEAQLNSPPSEALQSKPMLSDGSGNPFTKTSEVGHAPAPANETARIIPLEFANTLRALRQPIDPKLVKTREGWTDRQGIRHTVEYVEWHTVADILDRICPTWSHAVKSVARIGEVVAVTAALTIDNVTREGVGTGAADNETGIKKAEHDALKRAAVKFGIARELYQREAEVAESGDAGNVGGLHTAKFGSRRSDHGSEGFKSFPHDPVAKGTLDLVTPKQLGMINRMAREAGVNAEKECLSLLGCKPEDLSKRAASSLIDYLKEYPKPANKTDRRAG